MKQPDTAEIISFANAEEFDLWLSDNHQNEVGIWVKVAKKQSGIASITEDELVDIGLCWGWISGQRRSLDDKYYLQKYVPRRKHSIWSQINVNKVKALTQQGRMHESGLAEVAEAKADGRWSAAYASQRDAKPPQDLLNALAKDRVAYDHFMALKKAEQYTVLLQLATARTSAIRSARLEKLVTKMSESESI